mgnify:CR=1 FL=1
MKNKKKPWIIGLCFIVIGYFTLSLCDFMYIPASKYPTAIRKIFFTDNKNITVKSMGNVCQVEDGIYFLYKGRLMYMDNEGKAVDEVYSGSNYIGSIMENNSDIFFFCKDTFGMCKMSRYIDKKQLENLNAGIKPIINGKGDRNYIDGKYIYLFNGDMLSKYTLNGRKIYSSKIYYDQIRAGGFGSIVFNEYSMRMVREYDYAPGMGVDVPYHYLLGWDKVKYKQKKLTTFHYYKEASRWDRNNTTNTVEAYDTWAKKLDDEVRSNADKWDKMKDRNMDEYDLISIGLSKENPNYYRAVKGYIYFYQPIEFRYRDKNYMDKIKFNDTGGVNEEEIDKVEFVVRMYAMLRVKAEDIEKAEDGSNLDYEIINTPMYPINFNDFIENYEVNDNFLYSTSNGRFSMEEEEKIQVFVTDMNTDTTQLIYSRIKDAEYRYRPGLYCSDNYVFLYEYSNKEGEEGCRVTRFDKDGKNPVLVVDYTGEVVMEPVVPVQ